MSYSESQRRLAYREDYEKRRCESWKRALLDEHFRAVNVKQNHLDALAKERLKTLERYIKLEPRTAKQQRLFDILDEIAQETEEVQKHKVEVDTTTPIPKRWTIHGFPDSSSDSM